METYVLALVGAFFVVAVLFSSVGHAGASGYLAAMALLGLAPETMKPTALALNILVAGIVTVRFQLAGHIRWRSVAPFVAGSIPLAFVGGAITLPGEIYKPLVGAVLLFAAYRLVASAGMGDPAEADFDRIPDVPALMAGAGIGLLAGLTGTGGGIFLTPLLLFMRWSPARVAAGISAAFVLSNSLSGLVGNVTSLQAVPGELPLWLAGVAIGGVIGAELGARRLGIPTLRRALGLVLVVAGLKLIFLG